MRGIPAGGGEALLLVGRIRQRHGAVDRDVVVVPDHDQLVQPKVAGERDRLLGNAFHQAAVAAQHVSVVVDEVVAEGGVHDALAEREADAVGKALAERPGGRLDAGRMAIFRVTGRARAELAETLDLIDVDIGVAGQIEQRIEQHRSVAGRQDETVAIRPMWIRGVVFQDMREQHRGDVGATHRQAGMAGIRLLDRIHGKEADGVGHPVMFLALGHGRSLVWSVVQWLVRKACDT